MVLRPVTLFILLCLVLRVHLRPRKARPLWPNHHSHIISMVWEEVTGLTAPHPTVLTLFPAIRL